MPKYTLTYQGKDKFNNDTFYTKDPEQYAKIEKLQRKFETTHPAAKSPIYLKDEFSYANLRPAQSKFKYKPKNTYELTVEWRVKTFEGKQYLKAYIQNSRIVEEYIEDLGDIIDLDENE